VIGGGDAARAEQLAREHVIGVSQAISRGG